MFIELLKCKNNFNCDNTFMTLGKKVLKFVYRNQEFPFQLYFDLYGIRYIIFQNTITKIVNFSAVPNNRDDVM